MMMLCFPNQYNRALATCPRRESAREQTDILLEWLCLHLEEEHLPKGFDPRGRNLDVIRPGRIFSSPSHMDGNNGTGLSSSRIGEGKSGVSMERRLLQYGFDRAEVMRAIAGACKEGSGVGGEGGRGDSLDARMLGPLEVLASGLVPSGDVRRGGGRGGDDGFQTEVEGREAVEEEIMSLEAIYDEAVTVAPTMPLVGWSGSCTVRTMIGRWKLLYVQDETVGGHY